MQEEPRYLGTREAAEMLSVGESTVKRWVDQGILPAERTAGRHRKIRLEDLLRITRERGLPIRKTVTGQDVEGLAARLHAALAEGSHEQAHSLLREARLCGMSMAEVGDRLISPVMARIGHGWATGSLDVYEEHRASQACLSALEGLRLGLPRPPEGAPLALGGGPPGDPYLLANLLADLCLTEEGWAVENIGPNTPWPSLGKAVRARKPRLIWISCSYLPDPKAFLAGYATLHAEAVRAGAALAVGGRALTEDVRSHMGYSHHGDRLANLVEFARGLRTSQP